MSLYSFLSQKASNLHIIYLVNETFTLVVFLMIWHVVDVCGVQNEEIFLSPR